MAGSTIKHTVVGIEKLDGLEANFRIKAKKVIDKMQEEGWKLRIVWAKRTAAENDELVEKGVAKENSKHLVGKAVDLIDRVVGYSKDKSHKYYKDLKEITKEVGVTWGGNWSNPWDPCHFEASD